MTIDAMGSQTAIAEQIVAQGGDYGLPSSNGQRQHRLVALSRNARSV